MYEPQSIVVDVELRFNKLYVPLFSTVLPSPVPNPILFLAWTLTSDTPKTLPWLLKVRTCVDLRFNVLYVILL